MSESDKTRSREVREVEVEIDDDGRDIDPKLGTLSGEGSLVDVGEPEDAWPLEDAPEPVLEDDGAEVQGTYYGLPVLKEPVWKAYIPTYFYTGGVAGGSALIAAAAQLVGGRELRPLVNRARWIAVAAVGVSSALLIADLGRPSRFLNMLRVFRPTSPMNVGTWILSAAGATSGVAALFSSSPSRALRTIGDAGGVASGALGAPLAGYTAVLLANTAVPAWQTARASLPFLFVSSAATSAASLLDLFASDAPETRAVRAFGVAGKIAELASAQYVASELRASGPAGDVLRRSSVKTLWNAATLFTGASLALSLLPGSSRSKRVASGILGTLGALGLRFAVMEMGRASARDPRATFEGQRRNKIANQ